MIGYTAIEELPRETKDALREFVTGDLMKHGIRPTSGIKVADWTRGDCNCFDLDVIFRTWRFELKVGIERVDFKDVGAFFFYEDRRALVRIKDMILQTAGF